MRLGRAVEPVGSRPVFEFPAFIVLLLADTAIEALHPE